MYNIYITQTNFQPKKFGISVKGRLTLFVLPKDMLTDEKRKGVEMSDTFSIEGINLYSLSKVSCEDWLFKPYYNAVSGFLECSDAMLFKSCLASEWSETEVESC